MIRLGTLIAAVAALVTFSAQAANPSLSEQANAAFLAANAKKPGVITTASGLQYRIVQNGFGKRPTGFDKVTVNYKGQLINGSVFDSTEPGLPANFPVNGLIPGWTEALELMREGDRWQLVIPADLAYGTRGQGAAVPPNQTLVFDLELLKVTPPPPPQNKDDRNQ